MATSDNFDNGVVNLTAASGTTAGTVVKIGGVYVLPLVTVSSGEVAACKVTGLWKDAPIATGAIGYVTGAPKTAFYRSGAGFCITESGATTGSSRRMGLFLENVASGTTVGDVLVTDPSGETN